MTSFGWGGQVYVREPWFAPSGHAPMYVWQRRHGEHGPWPTSIHTGEPLARFTALTFPA